MTLEKPGKLREFFFSYFVATLTCKHMITFAVSLSEQRYLVIGVYVCVCVSHFFLQDSRTGSC